MVPIHLERYPTQAGREALASLLGLSIDPFSQDWEWEIAEPARFWEFFDASRAPTLSEDARVSLAEILVQCVEDLCGKGPSAQQVENMPEWQAVAGLLLANPRLHARTVYYWSVLGENEGRACFQVTEPMRRLWAEVQKGLP